MWLGLFVGLLVIGAGTVPGALPDFWMLWGICALGIHSSCWIALPRPHTGGGVWSYGRQLDRPWLADEQGRPAPFWADMERVDWGQAEGVGREEGRTGG